MMSSVTGGCPLALVILLLVSMDPTATELVNQVSDCANFFRGGIPPEIPGVLEQKNIMNQNRYKAICQIYEKEERFMTLYDIDKKIPVFSAYKYTGHKIGRPASHWRIEDKLANNQAKNKDFTGSSYHRGHLFPCFHANSEDDQRSTFTLTNCVPQDASFNMKGWRTIERRVKCFMDTYCLNKDKYLEAFLLTGAIHSNKDMANSGVNIPITLWTAFCCYSKEKDKFVAGANWGDNVGGKVKPFDVKTVADFTLKFLIDPFPAECLKTQDRELHAMFDKIKPKCRKNKETDDDCNKDAGRAGKRAREE